MTNAKELECINLAAEAKIVIAKRDLADLLEKPPQFDSPLAGFSLKDEWGTIRSWRMEQFLLSPVAVALIAFLVLFVPVLYIIHVYETWELKHSLKRKIKDNIAMDSPELPTEKTVQALWRLYGFRKYEGDTQETAALLGQWIGILYGDGVMSEAEVESELNRIWSDRIKGDLAFHDDLAFHEGRSNVHCHFGPPVDTLVRRLSEELPAYGSLA